MLPQNPPAGQPPRRIGVGIDTSRYGHYAVFLKDDLQQAADQLAFAESAAGYALLQQRLQDIRQRYDAVDFIVRLDVAGPYADNLLHFLHQLAKPDADAAQPLPLSISLGDPQRNKNYRAAFFGSHKSDPVEGGACPLHRGDRRVGSFSVNLEAHVFQCFDKSCGHKGDVIDLWAALHGLSLREAALDLVRTFGLERT